MSSLLEYIDKTVEQLQKEEKSLASTDRKDESNLVKIRINVYGICKTVYQVFSQIKSEDVLKEAYLEKLDSLAKGWRESYEKARKFEDVEKAVVEELKLQTISDIRQKFIEI